MDINIKPAHWPTNPVPAMSALIAAQEAGGGDLAGLCHGILRACWAEEKDISQDDVIKAALSANGFDAGLADSGMLSGSETIERNTNEALERGVFGAPTFLVDDQVVPVSASANPPETKRLSRPSPMAPGMSVSTPSPMAKISASSMISPRSSVRSWRERS